MDRLRVTTADAVASGSRSYVSGLLLGSRAVALMGIRARSAGTAKPMPTEPPVGDMIAVFTPTTCPCRSNDGPPELPVLIGASLCRKLT
jgi:hypothetical protein